MGLTLRSLLKFAEAMASGLIKEALGIRNPDIYIYIYLLFHQS